VPAAAVIPAPIAYIKVVAVKKLVVGLWVGSAGPPFRCAPVYSSLLSAIRSWP
jgi:hypothetical protein